jgi:hypothetical protein
LTSLEQRVVISGMAWGSLYTECAALHMFAHDSMQAVHRRAHGLLQTGCTGCGATAWIHSFVICLLLVELWQAVSVQCLFLA